MGGAWFYWILNCIVDVVPPGDNVVNFSDAEDLLLSNDLL